MCYYFEPIKAAIAQPFSTRMPKDRVCKRLKTSNAEICSVKYPVQVDQNMSDEEMLAPGLFVQDPVMGEFIGENIPLWIISNDDVGLLGARVRAERLLRE